jgi:hypothetical protein
MGFSVLFNSPAEAFEEKLHAKIVKNPEKKKVAFIICYISAL